MRRREGGDGEERAHFLEREAQEKMGEKRSSHLAMEDGRPFT